MAARGFATDHARLCLFAAYALAAKTARVRARQYCMASERKDAVEIRGCCSVACCPSAPQAEAMSCFKTEEVLRCWRELVHEKYGEGGGALLRSVVGSSHVTTEKVPTEPSLAAGARHGL